MNRNEDAGPRYGVCDDRHEAPADSTQGWRDTPAADPLDYLLRQWQRNDGHTLPLDSAERKCIPLRGGCFAYIPAALAAFAAWSQINNQKHNPGQPLHWSQANSADHEECIARHDFDAAEARDAKVKLVELTARFWRAGAELQMFAQAQGAPKAPGAK